MVSPSQRRAVVAWARAGYQLGERRACRALDLHRAMVRYESVKPDNAPVRRRLHEIAKDRPSPRLVPIGPDRAATLPHQH